MGYSFNCLPKFSANIFLPIKISFKSLTINSFCREHSWYSMVQTRSGKKTAPVEGISIFNSFRKKKWIPRDQAKSRAAGWGWHWSSTYMPCSKRWWPRCCQNKLKPVRKQTQVKKKAKGHQSKETLKVQEYHYSRCWYNWWRRISGRHRWRIETLHVLRRSTQGQGSAHKFKEQSIKMIWPSNSEIWSG